MNLIFLNSSVKNLAKTSFFVLALTFLFSANMHATTPLGVTSHLKVVDDEGTQAIALYIPETAAPRVLIKIKNDSNEVLFEKRVKVINGYARKFDLNGLLDGQYHLVITDADKAVSQAFQIVGDKVLMSKSDRKTFTHPHVQYNKAQDLMQVIAYTENPVEINVYDTKGDVIITETGVQPSKVYNLSALRKGNYTVEIRCEGEVFYKEIRL